MSVLVVLLDAFSLPFPVLLLSEVVTAHLKGLSAMLHSLLAVGLLEVVACLSRQLEDLSLELLVKDFLILHLIGIEMLGVGLSRESLTSSLIKSFFLFRALIKLLGVLAIFQLLIVRVLRQQISYCMSTISAIKQLDR